ncbi:2-C-methyl-D-erythritol 4-phosphate cytidylyltransferase 1 [Oxobacter pfennigii]|uniref:2-C-methyl-D-erythritol 4-phosphate cytidylyltransferase n=1 Tax=Oxobacter pfennigii TaxID=36849 RepID=A0A0P9AC35_9CLOT|nr:2-C-methyl-D-erythritol 4-phosphate cytidylyltransferase [Oxobacter pfennigii]KPU42657.1 2-C-methyl-D-erythritol 4-phosphate cytidylyltransferase 1 [Oxobacter pfennigii]
MYGGLSIGAVVVAAGKGKRMGAEVNKLFLEINNKPVLAYTLEAFESSQYVDSIIIAANENEMDYIKKDIIDRYKINKIKKSISLVAGGEIRQQSIIKGLSELKGACDIIVTHDGARPLVTSQIIDLSVEEAEKYGAAACAVPLKDTIKVVDEEGFVLSTPERATLYAIQTPQTFKFDILFSAHREAVKNEFIGTDDTVLVERLGFKIKLFSGSYENIKVTTPEDIYIAEAILNNRKRG